MLERPLFEAFVPASSTCFCLQVPASPVSKDAVLTWLEGREASMSEISDGLKAKQQQAALSNIMQELQDDFDVATKAGRYFLL